jgi:hypothetical protein
MVAMVAIDLLDMAVLRLTLAPSKHHPPVGQEHGRTIPLAEVGHLVLALSVSAAVPAGSATLKSPHYAVAIRYAKKRSANRDLDRDSVHQRISAPPKKLHELVAGAPVAKGPKTSIALL